MSTGADQHRPRPRPRHLRSLDDGQNRAARGGRCQSNVRAKAMPRPYAEAMRRGHEPRPCRGHAEAMRRGHAECEDKHIQGGGKAKKRKRQPTTASCSSTQITGDLTAREPQCTSSNTSRTTMRSTAFRQAGRQSPLHARFALPLAVTPSALPPRSSFSSAAERWNLCSVICRFSASVA